MTEQLVDKEGDKAKTDEMLSMKCSNCSHTAKRHAMYVAACTDCRELTIICERFKLRDEDLERAKALASIEASQG